MPIGEIFTDVRLILLVAVIFFALAVLYSSEGHGGCIGIWHEWFDLAITHTHEPMR